MPEAGAGLKPFSLEGPHPFSLEGPFKCPDLSKVLPIETLIKPFKGSASDSRTIPSSRAFGRSG